MGPGQLTPVWVLPALSTSPEARPFQAFDPVACGVWEVSQFDSSLSVWMLYLIPCHPFGLLFFLDSHLSPPDQMSAWTLKESPADLWCSLSVPSISPEELYPVLAPPLSSWILSSMSSTQEIHWVLPGFPFLPHGLGALSRQTLGKSLTFHLVFITWCPLSSKSIVSYILSVISVVLD